MACSRTQPPCMQKGVRICYTYDEGHSTDLEQTSMAGTETPLQIWDSTCASAQLDDIH